MNEEQNDKGTGGPMKVYDVKFHTVLIVEHGGVSLSRVGVGSDGNLFLDLTEISVRPEDLRETEEYPGDCPLVLKCDRDGRTYVNGRAVAEMLADPEARDKMKARIEWVLAKVKQKNTQRHEDPRNN